MKKKLLTLLLAVAASIGTMSPAIKIGALYYNLDDTQLTAEVTEIPNGQIASVYKPWRETAKRIIPSTIKYNNKTYNVTSIGDNAFFNCYGMNSVTIPNSVTSIGESAFEYCSSLTSIEIPNSVTSIGSNAFSGCSGLPIIDNLRYADTYLIEAVDKSLPSYSIKENTKWIANAAFSGCSNLTSIIIPNRVNVIGASAFYQCTDLNTITIGKNVTNIGKFAFFECVSLSSIVIPDSVKNIEPCAFRGCTALTNVTIGKNITNFEVYKDPKTGAYYTVFSGCKNITSVVWKAKICSVYNFGSQVTTFKFGNEVEVIPASICSGMNKLTSITIPNNVTSIGDNAFDGCSGLTSVTLGDGVTSIGENAFSGCTKLTSPILNAHIFVYMPASSTGAYSIPNGIKSIYENAFKGCTKLTSITIPNSIKSIGTSAFSGCTGLTSITIPNSVTSIGNGAFHTCSGLTSVTIPSSVTSIERSSFKGCSKLTTITLNSNAAVNVTGSTCYDSGPCIAGVSQIFGFQVKNIILGDSITSLPAQAFESLSNLTSITIGKNVKSIASNAFSGCSNITSVTWNAKNCNGYNFGSQVKTFKFGSEVMAVPASVCKGMTKLTSVTIPNSVTSIGSEAFSGCTGLTSITIPGQIKTIGASAFSGCTGFTSATIPMNVTNIGTNAFSGCTNLTSVVWNAKNCNGYNFGSQVKTFKFGSEVVAVPASVCKGMTKLTSVTIPNSVTSIGSEAFSGCTGLTSITIPASVTSIESKAFGSCPGLSSIIVEEGNTKYDSRDNCNAIILSSTRTIIFGCKNTSIPNSVTSIGDYAFNGCSSLKSIVIPSNVTNVDSYAFNGCSGLTAATLSDNMTTIKSYTFNNCSKLSSVIIGMSVTNIESNAFSGCSSLKTVTLNSNAITTKNYTASSNIAHLFGSQVEHYILGSNIARIGEYAFYSSSNWNTATFLRYSVPSIHTTAVSNINGHVTAYVPCGRKEAYDYAFSLNPGYSKLWTAYAPLKYNIYAVAEDGTMGCVTVPQTECDNLIATPNYGYHFVQWSDGSTANPRSLVLTKDTTFTAKFAKNPIVKYQCNAVMGQIVGDTITPTGIAASNITFEAQPNYGYHFIQWNDGVTENPRTIYLVQDTTFTAEFAINQYSINVSCDETYGHINGESGQFDYQSTHTYEAVANYGYHFTQWSDGVKTNPRTITITKDETYTALFAKNTYSITKSVDSERGSISGVSQAEYLDNVTLTAVSNYGYHFIQWSDGVTDNPRTFVLTQDTTFTAEFAKNTYTISTTSANQEWGTTAGDKSALYLENVVISATANYGYHFVKWNDNNTENPRTISAKKDATYTATFAKNTYYITKIANSTQGSISSVSQAEYLDNVTLTVNPNYGYHFTHWSDGNTDNPRIFVLTQDTTFTAEFAVDKSGTCGKTNLLQWRFADDGTLTISGSGELTENYTFGVEAPTQMQQLVVGNEVTAIGERAFYEKTTLQKLIIGSNVTSIGKYAFASINNRQLTSLVMPAELLTIGDYAFSGNTYLESIDFNAKLQSIGAYAFKDCYRVSEMTCLATVTPNVGTDALASINSYASLCVPAECLRKYQVDPNWGRFDLCELGTTSTVTENRTVTVEPTDNTAIFTWPTENNAASYSLQITKDGVVFCTLVFNSNGQLTGIAFAPGRNGAAHAPAATMSVAGMSFTVTGLDGASKYAYRLAVTNDASEELVAYSGEFATTGYTGEVNPGGNPEGIEDVFTDEHKASKILLNGQIFILRGGRVYDMTGQEVR